MYTLILNKRTKLILQSRYDTSTGEKMSVDAVLNTYCEFNNTDISTVEIVEIPYTNFQIELGKHIYENGEIKVDPNWVQPPSVETASIPVSGT